VCDRVYLVRPPIFGLLYQPRMTNDDACGAVGGMRIGRGNRNTPRRPAPSATLSTTNPTWHDLRSNPGRSIGKPANNRLNYGMATDYEISLDDTLLSCVLVTNNAGSGLDKQVYLLMIPPIITHNYSANSISTLYNSLLHIHQSSPGNAIETQEL
jgi:hypothetical protein